MGDEEYCQIIVGNYHLAFAFDQNRWQWIPFECFPSYESLPKHGFLFSAFLVMKACRNILVFQPFLRHRRGSYICT